MIVICKMSSTSMFLSFCKKIIFIAALLLLFEFWIGNVSKRSLVSSKKFFFSWFDRLLNNLITSYIFFYSKNSLKLCKSIIKLKNTSGVKLYYFFLRIFYLKKKYFLFFAYRILILKTSLRRMTVRIKTGHSAYHKIMMIS